MKDSEDEDDGMNSAIDASTIELISCLIPKIKDQLHNQHQHKMMRTIE